MGPRGQRQQYDRASLRLAEPSGSGLRLQPRPAHLFSSAPNRHRAKLPFMTPASNPSLRLDAGPEKDVFTEAQMKAILSSYPGRCQATEMSNER
jgi:hypothetical protein